MQRSVGSLVPTWKAPGVRPLSLLVRRLLVSTLSAAVRQLGEVHRHAAGLVAGQGSDLDQSADLLTADNLVWIGSQYLPRRTPVILS